MARMMKCWKQAALLPLLLLGGAAPQAASAPASEPGKQPGMIWKATSPTTTVYLVGSIHAATNDMYPLPPEMEKAFAEAKTLVVEVDITKANQLAMMMKMMAMGMYKEGDTLEKHVPAKSWKQIEAFCKEEGIPVATVEGMKPWMAGITLQGVAAMKAGLDPAQGIDMHFLNEDEGKKVVELESAEGQMNMLANLTEAEQLELVNLEGSDAKSMTALMAKLATAWKAGDDKTVLDAEKDAETSGAAGESIMKKLIEDRNGPMAQKIETLAEGKEPVFVVVGAAHLLGDKGILAMLAKKGLKVERVMVTAPPASQPAMTEPAMRASTLPG